LIHKLSRQIISSDLLIDMASDEIIAWNRSWSSSRAHSKPEITMRAWSSLPALLKISHGDQINAASSLMRGTRLQIRLSR
jgi:hypothetical protein